MKKAVRKKNNKGGWKKYSNLKRTQPCSIFGVLARKPTFYLLCRTTNTHMKLSPDRHMSTPPPVPRLTRTGRSHGGTGSGLPPFEAGGMGARGRAPEGGSPRSVLPARDEGHARRGAPGNPQAIAGTVQHSSAFIERWQGGMKQIYPRRQLPNHPLRPGMILTAPICAMPDYLP